MPKEAWLTILGGFLSGITGATLFFIQRWKEKGDQQQDILFRIYQLLSPRIISSGMDAFIDEKQRSIDIQALSFLVKDQELARDICLFAGPSPRISEEEIQKKILSRFNKKLYQELTRTKPNVDRSAGPEGKKP